MTKKQNILLKASIAIAVLFAIAPASNAMHIMEGYLQATFCIAWGVICLPFIVAGFFSIQKTLKQNRKTLILLAMSGAFVFVISSLKIPSVTGSCSHMTGTGLGAILFGPTAAGVLGLIVLLFQAILLAHGGLTTLGANTFSMAIAGPFLSYGIYKLCQKLNVNRKVAVFLAAFFGGGGSFRSEIPWSVCSDTASAGSNGRTSYGCDRDRTGVLCKTGTQSRWIFKGGKVG